MWRLYQQSRVASTPHHPPSLGGGPRLRSGVMPPRAKKPLQLGQTWVTYEDVIGHLVEFLKVAPRGTKKKLAAACGMDHAEFRHRITGRQGRTFEVKHFGAMARAVGLPAPWPFVDMKTAQAFEAFMAMANLVGDRSAGSR